MLKKTFLIFCFFFNHLFVINTSFADQSFGTQTKAFVFSGENSSVIVQSGASFNINQAITDWNGTLVKKAGATISGQPITFQDGVFNTGTARINLQGQVIPTGDDSVRLNGSSYLIANPGTIVEKVEVSGVDNQLRGQPLFNNPINFLSNTSTLSIALQSSLNQNIELNGGSIYLQNDLVLNDGVCFSNTGTIHVNGRRIVLGQDYSQSWTSELYWEDAQDIVLSSSLTLYETWRFTGTNIINGNGSMLLFTGTGRLLLEDGAVLLLTDIMLADVGNFSLEMLGDNAQIRLVNTTIQLAETCTTDVGSIYVEGESVFILGDKFWTFNNNASLTVDGVSLWVDDLSFADTSDSGKLCLPYPLFAEDDETNLALNLASGNLALVNNGILRRVNSAEGTVAISATTIVIEEGDGGVEGCSGCRSDITEQLIYGDGMSSLTLDQIVELHLAEGIEANDNITIDGNGAIIIFSDSGSSQLTIAEGKTLTLKNITLMRLNRNTFSLGATSKLNINENVTFELAEDIVWDQGRINFTKAGGTFIMRGLGRCKRFNINPNSLMWIYKDRGLLKIFTLYGMIWGLENVELIGEKYIQHTTVSSNKGAIGLLESAVVDVEQDTSMNFYVANTENVLCLKRNSVIFSGNLWFADNWINELHIRFFVSGLTPYTQDVSFFNLILNIESANGLAKLIFDDPYIKVTNTGGNSFVVGQNSYVGGNHVEICGSPIKQTAVSFTMGVGLNLISESSNAISSNIVRSPILIDKPTVVPPYSQYRDVAVSYLLSQGENPLDLFSSVKRNLFTSDGFQLRSFNDVSVIYDLYVLYSSLSLNNAKGSIGVKDGTINNFGVNDSEILNLVIDKDAYVKQGSNDVTLKADDTIYVTGSNCKIEIGKSFTINGTLVFTENSQLIFEFDNSQDDPEIFLNSSVSLPAGARLEFRGKGTVTFADGISINGTGGTASYFSLKDSAVLQLATGSSTIKGKINVVVENEAEINVDTDQQLFIGESTNNVINFTVGLGGRVRVEAMTDADVIASTTPLRKAKLSLHKATSTLSINSNSSLYIGNGGAFEINANSNVSTGGDLQSFVVGKNSELYIDNGGVLVLGSSSAIAWNGIEGTLTTGGYVQYAGTEFIGTLHNEVQIQTTLNSLNLVKRLINQVSVLTESTAFTDVAGNNKLRTSTGVIVSLLANDVVVSENTTAGLVYITNNDEFITIDSDGNRE